MTEIKEKLFNTKNVKHYQDMCLQQALVLKEKQIFISKFYNQKIQPLSRWILKKLNDSYFSDKFTSENYKLESYYSLANCFYGFNFINTENFDFLNSIQENQTNNSFRYSIQPRGGGSYNSIFLIVQQIQTTYSPLQFQKLSIKQFEFVPQKEAHIIISYQQGDYIFSNVGLHPIFVDKEFDKIQMLTQIKCEIYQTIRSTFNKFKKSVIQKSLTLIHRCDPNIKSNQLQIGFKNTDKSQLELVFNILEMSQYVSQIIYNQVKEEHIFSTQLKFCLTQSITEILFN
ncbi:unnamed protein product [Paramecium octaurelia]|uniref:Uncharacterized protein n=1 Tax=Paramecium octaurelia TaxID=43137 RepID=A0A8S1X5S2_PAROT|nr:unnamed protein product [Paramecium octaurelia]